MIARNITHSIRWTTLESLLYQGIFLAHLWALYRTVDGSVYGLIGTLFSSIYLVVSLSNLGLDASLNPFFSEWSRSKPAFGRFVIMPLMGNALLSAGASVIIFTLLSYQFLFSTVLVGIITLVTCLESIRKTLRTVQHLRFKANVCATAEIAMIVCYTTIVWGLHFLFGLPLTLHTLFTSLCLSSVLSTLYLLHDLCLWYRTLPDSESTLPTPYARLITTRVSSYAQQLSTVIFSSNFLVPLFALKCGLPEAGFLKIVMSTFYPVARIVQNIFGTTSNALFAHIKHETPIIQRTYFSYITTPFFHVLIGIVLFFIINYQFVLHQLASHQLTSPVLLIVLCALIILTDTACITYEKWFITQERAWYPFAVTAISILALVPFFIFHIFIFRTPLMATSFLLAIALSRVLCLLLLAGVSVYLWHLKPTLTMQPRYILTSLAISFIVLFFTH